MPCIDFNFVCISELLASICLAGFPIFPMCTTPSKQPKTPLFLVCCVHLSTEVIHYVFFLLHYCPIQANWWTNHPFSHAFVCSFSFATVMPTWYQLHNVHALRKHFFACNLDVHLCLSGPHYGSIVAQFAWVCPHLPSFCPVIGSGAHPLSCPGIVTLCKHCARYMCNKNDS